MKILEKKTVYDGETGEILSVNSNEYNVARHEPKHIENNGINLHLTGSFFKVSRYRRIAFSKPIFGAYFFAMLSCVGSNANCVMSPKSNYRVAINEKELMEHLGIKISTYKTFIAECKKKGYVGICSFDDVNKKKFIVNPAFCQYGRNVSLDVFHLFSDNIDFLLAIGETGKRELFEKIGFSVNERIESLITKNNVILSEDQKEELSQSSDGSFTIKNESGAGLSISNVVSV